MTRRIVVLDAPSNLGLKPPGRGRQPGVALLPDALRREEIVRRLSAGDAGRVEAPTYSPKIERPHGIRNAAAIAAYAHDLAARLSPLLGRDSFPLVLGGDCSILLGTLLAVRRRGRYGLCFLDGHLDLLTPQTSHTKGAAGMDLALALGHGPDLLANLDGLRPLVLPQDVVALGYRGPVSGYGSLATGRRRLGLLWLPLTAVRRHGAAAVVSTALARLTSPGLAGFWIHLDVDVLDDEVMPAVDSRQPGGLSYFELGEILRGLLSSSQAVGLQITILDPSLDPSGAATQAFVAFLAEAFAAFP